MLFPDVTTRLRSTMAPRFVFFSPQNRRKLRCLPSGRRREFPTAAARGRARRGENREARPSVSRPDIVAFSGARLDCVREAWLRVFVARVRNSHYSRASRRVFLASALHVNRRGRRAGRAARGVHGGTVLRDSSSSSGVVAVDHAVPRLSLA